MGRRSDGPWPQKQLRHPPLRARPRAYAASVREAHGATAQIQR